MSSIAKKRRDAIKRETRRAIMDTLRVAGKSCGSCRHFERKPIPSMPGTGTSCSLHSDFHGYSMVKADHLCGDWMEAPPPA